MGKQNHEILIVGAGAAGLMTAISAATILRESGNQSSVTLLDGAKKIGAKILVAGGGRCNVTHHKVLPKDYAGSSRNSIKNVLKAFGAQDSISFFESLGVKLKQEETGKMFPVTDSAHTVLDALLEQCRRLGVQIINPWRVGSIKHDSDRFLVVSDGSAGGELSADRLVLATGGMALPRTGSDGAGYRFAKELGHRVTPDVFPALVPLVTDESESWLTQRSGISTPVSVEVRSGSGKRLARYENEILCTHFGISGPVVLDISRWYLDAKKSDTQAQLVINWLGSQQFESLDHELQELGKKQVITWLRRQLPERLAVGLCERAGVEPDLTGHSITRDQRRSLVRTLTECPVEVDRDRGFTFAEATAGGVPLDEVTTRDMRSRICDRLWIVGELLDVDGRIGGFNFQWAWSTGQIAGRSLAHTVLEDAVQAR